MNLLQNNNELLSTIKRIQKKIPVKFLFDQTGCKGIFLSSIIQLFLLLILLYPNSSVIANNTQDSTVFYLVRHAEIGIGQMPLSETGKQRAQDLADAFQSKTINAIYTSNNVSDKETAKKVAKTKRLIINTYESENVEVFLKRILQQRKGQNLLIVGNLETIEIMLQKLSNSSSNQSINEKDYSTLFEVLIAADNTVQVIPQKYSQIGTMIGPNNDLVIENQNMPQGTMGTIINLPTTNHMSSTISDKTSDSIIMPSSSTTPEVDNSISKAENTETKNKAESTAVPSSQPKLASKKTVPSIGPEPKTTVEENKLPSLNPYYNLNKKGVALWGYDLVAYFKNNKAIKGEEKYATNYRGVNFYFSTRKNLNTFLEDSEKYLPKYGGWCALGMSIDGEKDGYEADKYPADPENFKIIEGELYIFYKTLDYDALQKWNEESNEAACIKRADSYWKKIIEEN